MKLLKLTFLILFIHSLAYAQVKCSDIAREGLSARTEIWDNVELLVTKNVLFGKLVDVYRVDRNQLHGGRFMGEELGGDDAFFIGLNSGGHMYLVANVYRYDGKIGFEPGTVREKTSWLDKGLVLRIEDPDGRIQDKIIDYLKNNNAPRSVNCAAGVCKVLKKSAQIEVSSRIPETVIPSAMIEHLILNGYKTADGKRKPVQLFMIGNADPKTVIDASDKLVSRYYKALKPMAITFGLSSAGLLAGFLSWLF